MLVLVFCGIGLTPGWPQGDDYRRGGVPVNHRHGPTSSQDSEDDGALTLEDRLSILAAALDSRNAHSERDCSHLVHAIYEQAGFPYGYAPSSEIYAHAQSFQRVKQPQTGDLIAWRGHLGIVIKPSQHLFFSFLTSGPGVDDYQSPYWRRRGKPRFYRYLKNSLCVSCDSDGRPHRLVDIKR